MTAFIPKCGVGETVDLTPTPAHDLPCVKIASPVNLVSPMTLDTRTGKSQHTEPVYNPNCNSSGEHIEITSIKYISWVVYFTY